MGRAPCCDKANVKKGPWSPEEDAKLKSYIEKHGTGGNWIALPQKIGLKRCGKSCRLRWLNYLRPNIKHGGFSEEEDNLICSLYISIGSRWSIIAAQLPGRTDNDIKNYWNTRLKKKLLGKQRKDPNARRGSGSLKQELKSGISLGKSNVNSMDYSFTCNNNNNPQITPYWPQLPSTPMQYTIHQAATATTALNDHASIQNLFIKLEGKFSNHSSNHLPVNYDSTSYQFSRGNSQMPQGQGGNFLAELGELMGTSNLNNTQSLEGLEFLLGEELMMMMVRNNNDSIACGGGGFSNGWDDMSSLAYPPLITSTPSCEAAHQQGSVQECSPVDESSCVGAR
ncbi:uncharacterized protein J3R85_010467, partial [Psidium guajava]